MFHYWLSLVIWLPILSGILVLFCSKYENLVKNIALVSSALSLLISIIIFKAFDPNSSALQFEELTSWIPAFNINYHLGIDGISLPLILLNNLITFLVLIASIKTIDKKVALYNSMFLIMTGFISGSFCALDSILFYVFFEAMLIPMYLIIGVWGSTNRIYAAIKFFLYTLLGSLLMLVALIYLYYVSGRSFEIMSYYHVPLTLSVQILLFIAFFFGFAVKVPMWPVHTWLPDAHPEAPTGGSMVLAAVTLKIGGYGFLRFILPIVPDAARYLAPFMITLSLIAIVYIGLVAVVQKDMKKLVAYSSISHMGFVTLGAFLFVGNQLNIWGLEGLIIQMISHGFISAAMFMCIGIMYDRIHSRNIQDYGGVAVKMPVFAAFFMLFAMANSGLPGTSGFVGEFMVIMGALQTKFIYGFFAALTLILGASYTLWMYKKVVFGEPKRLSIQNLQDINKYELSVLLILAIAVIASGIYPNLFLAKMHASTQNLIDLVSHSKLI